MRTAKYEKSAAGTAASIGGKAAAEAWTLALLFAAYLALTIFAERTAQQTTRTVTPSSFNAKSSGLKAYYLLLEAQGFRADRLRASWQRLGSGDSLLIVAEPTDPKRPILPEEIVALKKWIEAGGSLLYFAAETSDLNPNDPLTGDTGVVRGNGAALTAAPEKRDSPYTKNVQTVAYETAFRLQPTKKARYNILLKDEDGALLIEKTVGKGRVLVSTMGGIASNSTINKADNAVLLVNLAATLSSEDRIVEFDEYHHGVGFDAEKGDAGSVWAIVPMPLRLALYAGALLGAVLLYNNNRMFGRLREAPPLQFRTSADYVGSAATLLHRAGAADLAVGMIYERFIRDLKKNLDLPPESDLTKTVAEAQKRYSVSGPQMQQTLQRCEAAQESPLRESEMLTLARELESYRRICKLV